MGEALMLDAATHLEAVLPVYAVVDVSSSMAESASSEDLGRAIDCVNGIVPALRLGLMENRILADKVRFSLIDFSDEANVVLPMMALQDLPPSDIPVLTTRGGSSYGAAFRLLKERIEEDREVLRRDRLRSYRPVVFFVSDGEPTDGRRWKPSYRELVGSKWSPNVVPLGVPGAVPDALRLLPYPTGRSDPCRDMPLLMASDRRGLTQAIPSVLGVMTGAMRCTHARDRMKDPYDVFELPDPQDLPEGLEALGVGAEK